MAHSIKGACLNLSANNLAKLAGELELSVAMAENGRLNDLHYEIELEFIKFKEAVLEIDLFKIGEPLHE